MQEVRRAVERIDEPAGVEVFASRFLAEDGKIRLALEYFAYRVLAREIRLAHPVAGRLLADVTSASEVRLHHRAAGACGALAREKQRVEIERAHVTAAATRSASSGVPAATIWRRASGSAVATGWPDGS